MMRIGYILSSEEFGPHELLEQARMAEQAGFEGFWISDHYHPWTEAQGQSPFAWSMIGALSQVSTLPVTTAVTCPTVRLHPAVVAQAVATSAVLHSGRFVLGVGSGEALNEHIFGDAWPVAKVRQEMLEEAIEVMRKLWDGGFVDHRGKHYTVENARVYTLPEARPKVYVSGFGRRSVDLAARIGDGYISTRPDPELVRRFHDHGGAGKPTQAGFKACYAADVEQATRIAYQRWRTDALPGELGQVLPSPRHFEQAGQLVTAQMMTEAFALGPDPRRQLAMIEQYANAGYDELYVTNIGPHHREFFDLYSREVLPALVRSR
jgi:G6PDH family F420-dependent oxidoreductase